MLLQLKIRLDKNPVLTKTAAKVVLKVTQPNFIFDTNDYLSIQLAVNAVIVATLWYINVTFLAGLFRFYSFLCSFRHSYLTIIVVIPSPVLLPAVYHLQLR